MDIGIYGYMDIWNSKGICVVYALEMQCLTTVCLAQADSLSVAPLKQSLPVIPYLDYEYEDYWLLIPCLYQLG